MHKFGKKQKSQWIDFIHYFLWKVSLSFMESILLLYRLSLREFYLRNNAIQICYKLRGCRVSAGGRLGVRKGLIWRGRNK